MNAIGLNLERELGVIVHNERHSEIVTDGDHFECRTALGFPVGLLLANFAFLISVPLGDQWAWRVPFLLSAVLIVVGILILMFNIGIQMILQRLLDGC
jgi:hypothetical protein